MNAETISGRKILVVDDDRSLLSMLGIILSAAGAEVITAEDPGKAEDLAQREHPDVLVTDVEMSGMNGFEVAKRVEACLPNPVAIVVTSCNYDHRPLAEQRGYSFVPKPFGVEDLFKAVSGACAIREPVVYAQLHS